MPAIRQERRKDVRNVLRRIKERQLRCRSAVGGNFEQSLPWTARSVSEHDESCRTPGSSNNRSWNVTDVLRYATEHFHLSQGRSGLIRDITAIGRPKGKGRV